MPIEESKNIDITPYIDHSLLGNAATPAMVEQWCQEADRFGFAAVCVNPCYVRQVTSLLHGKKPQICTVIGFPTGATTTATKLYEAQEAAENGAQELDVVINIGWLKAGKADDVHREIGEICESTGLAVKAILEMSLLTPPERELAAQICMEAGARMLKTGTGWAGDVTVEDVRVLKDLTKNQIGIKAAGGIRTHAQAVELILAGATRLGTSWSIDLLKQRERESKAGS
ncbi:deoxyribose-phosphate aldolase [Chamaesiphon polymorphus]|uniref:Deoxyribose-phosphate aldolase n=1 Tax=Chamaesiphon polymorphus CCALA 037 TaxID=2107692 RepID=A0A2T1GFQ9_9CYAN|nr:deoxyribose-phosphate aldolase [Chamaesiphon polymorphus]PSB56398.1 deoxyribose-phosphate aldolase [Chamaesiphon polymorphus CCALA 037]